MAERNRLPWSVEASAEPEYLDGIQAQFLVHDRLTAPIAYCFEREDADMIAAGPEMLGALIQVRARFQNFNLGPDEAATLRRVDEAIARAKGDT